MLKPKIIPGDIYSDERGRISFINDFDMSQVKRFYTIFHSDIAVIRAWQGHQVEQKWFVVLEGDFDIALVQPDNWETPSSNLPVQLVRLSSSVCQVLHVPNGFATGFKAVVPNSKMIIYSDLKLDESAKDDFRFDKSLWHPWN